MLELVKTISASSLTWRRELSLSALMTEVDFLALVLMLEDEVMGAWGLLVVAMALE